MYKWDPQLGLRLNGKGLDGGGVRSIKLRGQQGVVRYLLVIVPLLQPPVSSSSSLGTGPVLWCLWGGKKATRFCLLIEY